MTIYMTDKIKPCRCEAQSEVVRMAKVFAPRTGDGYQIDCDCCFRNTARHQHAY